MVGVTRERTRNATTNNGTAKSLSIVLWGIALILQLSKHGRMVAVDAFVPFVGSLPSMPSGRNGWKPTTTPSSSTSTSTWTVLEAAPPRRLPDNADGPLYVNDKCINCSACSMFAPTVFSRGVTTDTHHIVSKQPCSELEIEESRAALAACPVAAIRVEPKKRDSAADAAAAEETENQLVLADQLAINPKFNGRELPFPRPVSPNLPDVHFIGHHNSRSFGAAPYLLQAPSSSVSDANDATWVLVDTPLYSKRAVEAVESLTGPKGPSFLVLTHVDDTADHNRWKEHYPNLKRIFHAGDLGVHNWIGDQTLEDVEILLHSTSSETSLQYFDLNGTPIDSNKDDNDDDDTSQDPLVLVHTPGHSPGSISLLKKPTADSPGVLFSGDTYSYTTRDGGHLSGFPRYGNDARLQSKILPQLLDLDWKVLAPGHGHVRDYTLLQSETQNENESDASAEDLRRVEMKDALDELTRYF